MVEDCVNKPSSTELENDVFDMPSLPLKLYAWSMQSVMYHVPLMVG